MTIHVPSLLEPRVLSQLFDHMSEGLYVSTPDRFVYANVAALEILGVDSLSRLQELHPSDVYAKPQQRQELLGRLERQGWVRRAEVELRRPDGSVRHVIGSATLIRNGEADAPTFVGVFADVTELRHAKERLEALVETSPVPIALLRVDGQVEIWNQAAERVFGYSREEIDGRIEVLIPPDLREESQETRERLCQGDSISGLVTRRLRKDGREIVVRLSSGPVRDASGAVTGYMTIGEDVTNRVARQEALQRSEERLREVTENIREVFYTVSRDFQDMTYVSPAYEEIWGRPVQELYDDPIAWLEAIHPDDRSRTEAEVRESHRRDEPYTLEYRIVRPNGDERWIHVRGFPVRKDGEVVRFTGVARDITERKRLEERLQHARHMAMVGRLAGGIAHEFNNLLTAIKGHAELMLAELPEDGTLRADAAEVVAAARRAAELTRQLLTFARKRRAEPSRVDLNDVVEEMREGLRAMLDDEVELRLELDRSLGSIRADPIHLEELLVELVKNARDAMPEGGTVTLETRRLEIDEATAAAGETPLGASDRIAPGGWALLSVHDTGVGMDEEVRRQVFEPFFTTRDVGEGSGLGLAHAYGIVKEFRGQIWVESAPGEGSTFCALFPLVDADREDATGDRKARTEVSEHDESETVLVTEDDPSVRRLLVRSLEKEGYRVLQAATPEEAVETCQAAGSEVDLLLTDVRMPGMEGPELAARLRELLPDLRVLFVSGYSEASGLLPDELAPTEDFLAKPFSPSALKDKVREVLDRES